MEKLTAEFWNDRYLNDQTGWDLGQVSPPIKLFFDNVKDKSSRILIPGCGNAHEAEYLHLLGFENVHVIDFAQEPLDALKNRVQDFPKDHIHHGDFFKHQGEYDYIIEQTMFCAIDPALRIKYADQINTLLIEGGMLVGVMFRYEMNEGPPYGGTEKEYYNYFSKNFSDINMEECYNSIEPRKGRELFVRIRK